MSRPHGFKAYEDLWRGSLLPLECAALAKIQRLADFWGRYAAQREQARSPQRGGDYSLSLP